MTTEPDMIDPLHPAHKTVYTVPATTQAERDAMDAARPKTVGILVMFQNGEQRRLRDVPEEHIAAIVGNIGVPGMRYTWIEDRDVRGISLAHVVEIRVNDCIHLLDEDGDFLEKF